MYVVQLQAKRSTDSVVVHKCKALQQMTAAMCANTMLMFESYLFTTKAMRSVGLIQRRKPLISDDDGDSASLSYRRNYLSCLFSSRHLITCLATQFFLHPILLSPTPDPALQLRYKSVSPSWI